MLGINNNIRGCEAAAFYPESDSLLDQIAHLNEDEHKGFNNPFSLTPVFPKEDISNTNIESNQDPLDLGMLQVEFFFSDFSIT